MRAGSAGARGMIDATRRALRRVLERRDTCVQGGVMRVAVAVSGGPDSMAAALAVARVGEVVDGVAVAPHLVVVDHRLRPESRSEAETVTRDYPGSALFPNLGREDASILDVADVPSSQEHARLLRYGTLAEFCETEQIPVCVTGHTATDVAESFILRAAQASGIAGLAAMAPIAPLRRMPASLSERKLRAVVPEADAALPPFLVRPLLGYSSAETRAACVAMGMGDGSWVEDPSNVDGTYARVRARTALGSDAALAAQAGETLAETAFVLRDIRDQSEAIIQAAEAAVSVDGGLLVEPLVSEVAPVIAKAVVERKLLAVSGRTYPPRANAVASILALPPGASRTVMGVLVRHTPPVLTFAEQPV